MCGRCEGEPYRGVKALFNGDLQSKMRFADREDWQIISPRVTIHLGESALPPELNALFRGCESAIASLTVDERTALDALSKSLGRPTFGKP